MVRLHRRSHGDAPQWLQGSRAGHVQVGRPQVGPVSGCAKGLPSRCELGTAPPDLQPHGRRLPVACDCLPPRHAPSGAVPVAFTRELATRQQTNACCNRGVGAAMMRRDAKRIKRGKMHRCGIAHIGLPPVAGVAPCEFGHELVSKDLCDD